MAMALHVLCACENSFIINNNSLGKNPLLYWNQSTRIKETRMKKTEKISYTSMTWGTWVYLMPDSAKSMISSKDLSKLGMSGQTSPTCPDRPRAERQKETAAVNSFNEQTKCMNRNDRLHSDQGSLLAQFPRCWNSITECVCVWHMQAHSTSTCSVFSSSAVVDWEAVEPVDLMLKESNRKGGWEGG